MSVLHHHSLEGTTSALDLWLLPSSQASVLSGSYIHYQPVGSLDPNNSCVEFNVNSSQSEYIDLSHCLLYVKLKVVSDKGETIPDASDAAVVNNTLHSLWSQLEVSLNNKLISQAGQNYSYRAYFTNLLSYGSEAKETHLSAGGWYFDSPGQFETRGDDNVGYRSRKVLCEKSREFDLIGPIHADIFSQDRFLLNNVSLNLKFTRNRDAFVICSSSSEKISLIDCRLLVRKVTPTPDLLLAHAKALEVSPAKYPIVRTDLKSFTLASGLQSKTLEWNGLVPRRMIIGLVTNKSYNGDFKLNPFNFQTFGLNHLCVQVDGTQYPNRAFTPDFENKIFGESYYSLFNGTGIHFGDAGNELTREDFLGGSCIHTLDLTPCLTSSQGNWNLQKNSLIRIEVRFVKGLTEPVNLLVFSEFDNLLQINKNRDILVDYTT